MAVKFLSPEWAQTLTDALNADDGFTKSIANVDLTLAYKVNDGPDGETEYHLAVADGAAAVNLGPAAEPDVTITSGHDTALALQRGELNPQAAFMTGKIKVAGNLAMLMMHQAVLSAFSAVSQDVDIEL